MFTKTIPITESIESHLNSSSDSYAEDNSEDSKSSSEEYIPPSLDDVKFKHDRYSNYCQKVVTRKKALEGDKTGTMWKSLYYTFFSNQNQNTITLNELELRCKFLFNMDKINKENDPSTITKKKGIEPITNLEKFAKFYLEKREDNWLLKIFRRKKENNQNKEDDDDENYSPKNYKKAKTFKDFIVLEKDKDKDKEKEKEKDVDKDKEKHGRSKSVALSKPKLPEPRTLFELYDIKDNNDLVDSINILQMQYKKESPQLLENLNNIIENKHSFMVEIEKMNKIFGNNHRMKNDWKPFIEVNSCKEFFESHYKVDLISKYEHSWEPQNRMSRQVNTWYNKVISKLDPLQKINI